MIDIHCHILPGIDDGAGDTDQSLEMAAYAVKEGISGIIATPHYIHDSYKDTVRQHVENEVDLLNKLLQKNSINLHIYTGAEIFISPEIPDLVRQGTLCTLNNSRYILIELPMRSMPIFAESVFYELELLGLVPIIAHPERKSEVIKDPGILTPFIEKGMLLQINSGSLTGFYGQTVAKTAWKLLDKGMAHVVATDAHNIRSRAPAFRKAYEMVENRVGKETAEVLFDINTARILGDEDVEIIKHRTKKSFGIGSLFKRMGKMEKKDTGGYQSK